MQSEQPGIQKLDLREKGLSAQGTPQFTERRLYVQLQVLDHCRNIQDWVPVLQKTGFHHVLYADVNNPCGAGILTLSEKPDIFAGEMREIFSCQEGKTGERVGEFTMFGRSYASGFEPNVEDWLIERPKRAALNPSWPWAIWYPLRRKPEFYLLSREEQGPILKEHGMIGRQYGQAGYAMDIRLACFGMDKCDNEFVIGLVGADLHPLSRVVQEMRKTQQTGRYMDSLGPFFIGKSVWQSPLQS